MTCFPQSRRTLRPVKGLDTGHTNTEAQAKMDYSITRKFSEATRAFSRIAHRLTRQSRALSSTRPRRVGAIVAAEPPLLEPRERRSMLSAVVGSHARSVEHRAHHHLSSPHHKAASHMVRTADVAASSGGAASPDLSGPVKPVKRYGVLTITAVTATAGGGCTATVTSDGSEPGAGTLVMGTAVD